MRKKYAACALCWNMRKMQQHVKYTAIAYSHKTWHVYLINWNINWNKNYWNTWRFQGRARKVCRLRGSCFASLQEVVHDGAGTRLGWRAVRQLECRLAADRLGTLQSHTTQHVSIVKQRITRCQLPRSYTTCTIRYDTRRYFNVRSKADTSQLNLPHGPTTKKCEERKTKKQKTAMLGSIGKQSGESVESVLKKKWKAMFGRICRKGRL